MDINQEFKKLGKFLKQDEKIRKKDLFKCFIKALNTKILFRYIIENYLYSQLDQQIQLQNFVVDSISRNSIFCNTT